LARTDEPSQQAILAFSTTKSASKAMRRKDYPEAIRRFEAAIHLDGSAALPAYLNLGDVRVAQGRTLTRQPSGKS